MKICQHCKAKAANRPRGLCSQCYGKPFIRVLYPSVSKYAPKSTAWSSTSRRHAKHSTDARPGTEAKIRVLKGRFHRGEWLFHPDDVTVLRDDDRLDAEPT